jgi:hypothetical protein
MTLLGANRLAKGNQYFLIWLMQTGAWEGNEDLEEEED